MMEFNLLRCFVVAGAKNVKNAEYAENAENAEYAEYAECVCVCVASPSHPEIRGFGFFGQFGSRSWVGAVEVW